MRDLRCLDAFSTDEEGKCYGVIIGKKIQKHDQLMELLWNYHLTRLDQSFRNDYYFPKYRKKKWLSWY